MANEKQPTNGASGTSEGADETPCTVRFKCLATVSFQTCEC